MNGNNRLALIVAATFAAGAAHAEKIDFSAEMVKRLDKAGKLKPLYKEASKGREMPKTMNATLYFLGDVKGKGLRLSLPAAVVSQPKVIAQAEVDNCFSETVTEKFELAGETTKSANFQNSDTLELGQKLEVSVTYDSPFGVSGMSATMSASTERRQVSMKSEGGSDTETQKWSSNRDIPIPPDKGITVQLVVTEQKIASLGYTANYVLGGPAKLVFSAGAAGYTWEPRRGSALPTSPYPPLKVGAQSNGAPLYICRVKAGDNYYYGKTHGDSVCYYGSEGQATPGIGVFGLKTDAYEYLLGSQDSITLGDSYAKFTFDGDGKGGQICVQGGGAPLPGFVTKDGQCLSHYDNRTTRTRDYKVLLDPRQGGVETNINLTTLLPNDADRTFDLRGAFSGVSALNNRIVYGRARKAECGTLDTATTAGGMSAGYRPAKGPTAKGGTKRPVVKRTAPGAPLPEALVKG
jgi:hypothetical protein